MQIFGSSGQSLKYMNKKLSKPKQLNVMKPNKLKQTQLSYIQPEY